MIFLCNRLTWNIGVAPGQRKKAHEAAEQIRAEWKAMSHAEKMQATQEGLVYLEEKHENKKHTVHNVRIAAFHDVRASISSIEDQVKSLMSSSQHVHTANMPFMR